MNLALNFNDANLSDITNQTQKIVDNLIYLDKYKDCKAFVNFVNKKNAFKMMLCLLEVFYYKKVICSNDNNDISLTYFNEIINLTNQKIIEIKNYPHKDLKKKYLKLDNFQLETFELFKSRYSQIIGDNGQSFADSYRELINDDNVTYLKLDFESLSADERRDVFIGLVYENYWSVDADILVPTVKKYIKNAYAILKKNNIEIPQVSFEEQIYLSSKTYRKALIELAK